MPETSADDRTCSLREHNYIGLPEASSCPSRKLITATDKAEGTLEETELRLDLGLGLRVTTAFAKRASEGQPKELQASRHGLQSELSNALSLSDLGSFASKNWMKRPFSQTIVAVPSLMNADNGALQDRAPAPIWASSNARGSSWHPSVLETSLKGSSHVPLDNASAAAANGAPPTKDRVVGWPPVRSYRKQALAKPAEFFVKVNMDGITVGRKVDLNAHNSYGSLQRALEEMFRPSFSGTLAAPAQEQEVKTFSATK